MKNWTLALALGTAVATTAIGLEANPASAGTLSWGVSFTILDTPPEDFKGIFVTEDVLSTDPMTGFTGYRLIYPGGIVNGIQDNTPVTLLNVEAFRNNNNLFYFDPNLPNLPSVDIKGISYQEMGGNNYQLFHDGTNYRGCATNDCNTSGEPYLVENFKVTPIPEPTSTLGLFALGTLGAASTLKRKLKPSKSTEKETAKVG
jgi:hypothetical protein